ncbi:MAG: ThuA domain-containing protein, partial [Armatimonadota bacterium]
LNSDNWQNHMILHIKAYERRQGSKQHLVWKTATMERGQNHRTNALLLDSPADVVSLNSASMGDYRKVVPAADGAKISILDTDHLWCVGGNASWVWKSFTRGHHPVFMDPHYPNPWGKDTPEYERIRKAMGHTRSCAERLDLAAMSPQAADSAAPSSTRYCLFNSGEEYLVYQPGAGAFRLLLPAGAYRVEWFNTATGEAGPSGTITWRGGKRIFVPPSGEHRVLCVAARKDIGSARANDGESWLQRRLRDRAGARFTVNQEECMAKIRTLLFAGGEIHDYKGCGPLMEDALKETGDFDIAYVEQDLSVLEAPKLDPYDLVVFYYTVGEITDAQKNGLLNFVASGKGFATCHSGADSFRDCPEYRAMVGGYFVTHPHFRSYQVSVVDPEHPITEGLDEFVVEDEQYIVDYDPRVRVLASALWKGTAMPVAWIKPWGKGRVFYLALGHNPDACKHEMFRLLLQRGSKWAGTPPAG